MIVLALFCAFVIISFGFDNSKESNYNRNIWFDVFFDYLDNSKLSRTENHQFQLPVINEENSYSYNSVIPADTGFNSTQDTKTLNDENDLFIVDDDTLKTLYKNALDSLALDPMALDSTARLEHFRYQRKDIPYTQIKKRKPIKFYAQPSSQHLTKSIQIDSTGKIVEIVEKIAGQQTKILLRLTIDEYIELRLASRNKELWEELAYKYELKDLRVDLSDFIKDITDFEIPLPSVGILSIFGTPKINLQIGGAVDIKAGWRNESTEGVTASLLGNTRNEPSFSQQVQINVRGTIGEKLQINADWNTERQFEYENQLKIKYTGFEDEIIQSIEAGNVSLQTSPLVGGSEALFGVKANFQLGPFSLTTLASQKKGEIKEVAVSGGSQTQEFELRATDYSTNHYFIDTNYASTNQELNLFNKYFGNPTPIVNYEYFIKEIEVWKSVSTLVPNPNERTANVFIDLDNRPADGFYPDNMRGNDVEAVSGKIEKGRFLLLQEGADYTLIPEIGLLSFRIQIQTDEVIAVAYRVENGPTNEDDVYYGEFVKNLPDDSTTLVLRLIKPQNLQPQYKPAWNLQLKNIYSVGGRNVKQEGFELDIKYEIVGQEPINEIEGVRLLESFGLDLVDQSDQPNPDGLFDFKPGKTIFPETGEILFPYLQPFGRQLPAALPDSLRFNQVYDTSKTFAQQNRERNKFLIKGMYSGEASSVYNLGFSVVENSVRVLLNGRELSAGIDYVVDYNIGQLTIRNDAALVPGADLRITFEQNDMFQLASKTLLGARGLFDFSQKTKLGFSILNLNQQTLSDKVRIGEEPLNNSIYGIDFMTGADLPFITKALDNIISTRTMSSFSVRGEFAYIDPDPNTKKSTVPSDDGKSIAYIDDFEGAKRIIPVGVSYTSWKDLSPPDSLPSLSGLTKIEMMDYKARAFWFNFLPSNVAVTDIWPEKRVARGEDQVTVLDFVFVPDTPGTYNRTPDMSNPKQNWGGSMKVLSSTASNLIEENIEFIEFWMKPMSVPEEAKIYIDLGKISEDIIPNGVLDTEDKNKNGLLDDGEDTGIDGIFSQNEPGYDPVNNPDPNKDNWSFQQRGVYNIWDYFFINGTEGNAELTEAGRFPDTEDINGNGRLDMLNSYYRYEIPLDTNRLENPFIAGGGNNDGWYLYRIPLTDFTLEVGSPSFSVVEFIRMFTTDVEDLVHLRLAEFNLVGSQWQKVIPDDSVLSISVVNVEDNPGYISPPGVERERDRSRPDEEIFRNEQSLSLLITDLQVNDKREAVKYLFRPLDVFNYSEMKLYIRGDINDSPGSVSYYVNENDYASEVYFRFGGDSNNYYEYRQPVRYNHEAGSDGWDEISIMFDQLTAIKQARTGDSINVIVSLPVPGKPGHFYRVKGNPTLTAVRFLTIGIFNASKGSVQLPVSGDVWVNELRVIGADDSPGWAYSASANFTFADLLTVNMNLSETNPYFHKLTDRFGSRVHARNWGVSADLDVMKLVPFDMSGSNLRVTYSRTESVGKPLYLPGTDVLVEEASKILHKTMTDSGATDAVAQKAADQLKSDVQTINTSDTWNASNIKLRLPWDHWLIRDTFNSLTFGFNYNNTFSRNPSTLRNKAWVWNASMNYALSLSPDYHFYPVDIPLLGTIIGLFTDYRNIKINYVPQTFSLNVTARRNRSSSISRPTVTSPNAEERISRDFTATRGMSVAWKVTEGGFLNLGLNYSFDVNSSLAYLEVDALGRQRSNSNIFNDIINGAFFGKDSRFSQNFDIRTSPRLPTLWDINKFFTINTGYGAAYSWSHNFQQEELGRSAQFSNKFNFSLSLRLKALTAPLFAEDTESTPAATGTQQQTPRRGRDRDLPREIPDDKTIAPNGFTDTTNVIPDSLKALIEDIIEEEKPSKPSTIANALQFLKSTVSFIFFDYENININFNNDNTFSASGLAGKGTGIKNFWGISYDPDDGPSRAFMLGLKRDVGPRALNGNLQDNYSQRNSIDLRTSRPLWEGAKIDITWKVGWSVNRSTSLQSDSLGNIRINNITSTGSIDRSFLSMPPVLIFSSLKSGIKQVNELYNPNDPNANLSEAFLQGFETAPLLSKIPFLNEFAQYIPRPNWRLTWDGLEKFFLFKSVAQRVSLDHAYNSSYTEGWRLNPDGIQEIQTQKINYAFAPLVGLNITFEQLWGGNLSASVKYNTRTNYDLGASTRNITEVFSRDIGITASYSKSGFEIPLFGLSLRNDIEFTFSYTNTRNSTVVFDMTRFTEEGTPQDGTIRTTIEPRVKYVMSSKVTLSIYYIRSTQTPEGASRIPPTTSNEAGLDVRITI